ncbi:uncharacterized protein LOC142360907 isoform X2 [Opisthocomus hoazin]|uniref:uncharacterized protein LOC142360907 isoform X2 n=1 Tax=Opisthocomus hoazin TaxID=30419 RepID=UPI003F52FF88
MRGAAEQHGGGLVSGAGAAGEQRGQRWGTAKRPELGKRNGGEQDGEASEAAESPGSAESESCGAGEPNDWSSRRRREERRREKHLKCPSLPAAPRVRAAWPAPCSSFLAASAEQRVAPGGDGRTVRRWINGRSCGKECRGVGGAEGASGAPSPGAERLPGLAGYFYEVKYPAIFMPVLILGLLCLLDVDCWSRQCFHLGTKPRCSGSAKRALIEEQMRKGPSAADPCTTTVTGLQVRQDPSCL